MASNPYPPSTISHAVAAYVLEQAARERWATDAQIRVVVPRARPALISKVRERLRLDGALPYKGAFSRWPHRRNERIAALLLALVLTLPTVALAQPKTPTATPRPEPQPTMAAAVPLLIFVDAEPAWSLWVTDLFEQADPCADPWGDVAGLEVERGSVAVQCIDDGRYSRTTATVTGQCRVVRWYGVVVERRDCIWLPGVTR